MRILTIKPPFGPYAMLTHRSGPVVFFWMICLN